MRNRGRDHPEHFGAHLPAAGVRACKSSWAPRAGTGVRQGPLDEVSIADGPLDLLRGAGQEGAYRGGGLRPKLKHRRHLVSDQNGATAPNIRF